MALSGLNHSRLQFYATALVNERHKHTNVLLARALSRHSHFVDQHDRLRWFIPGRLSLRIRPPAHIHSNRLY
jgi:hypothetical protein